MAGAGRNFGSRRSGRTIRCQASCSKCDALSVVAGIGLSVPASSCLLTQSASPFARRRRPDAPYPRQSRPTGFCVGNAFRRGLRAPGASPPPDEAPHQSSCRQAASARSEIHLVFMRRQPKGRLGRFSQQVQKVARRPRVRRQSKPDLLRLGPPPWFGCRRCRRRLRHHGRVRSI